MRKGCIIEVEGSNMSRKCEREEADRVFKPKTILGKNKEGRQDN